MDKELLRGDMPQDQWDAFYARCVEWGIPMGADSLEYGSVFLHCKAWFSLGWDDRADYEEK